MLQTTDLAVYVVVLIQLCASLPLFLALSPRLRRDLLRILCPAAVVLACVRVGLRGGREDSAPG